MKIRTILLVSAIIISAFNVFAQTQKSIPDPDENPIAFLKYKHSEMTAPLNMTGGTIIDPQYTGLKYKKSGNTIKLDQTNSNDASETYTYYSDGKLKEFYRVSTGKQDKWSYTYNSKGLIQKTVHNYNYPNFGLYGFNVTEVTYNSKDLAISTLTKSGSSMNDLSESEKNTYTYNTSNQLSRAQLDVDDNGNSLYRVIHTFGYTNSKVVSCQKRTYDNGSLTSTSNFKYSYAVDGNLTEIEETEDDGVGTETYTYNSLGKIARVDYYYATLFGSNSYSTSIQYNPNRTLRRIQVNVEGVANTLEEYFFEPSATYDRIVHPFKQASTDFASMTEKEIYSGEIPFLTEQLYSQSRLDSSRTSIWDSDKSKWVIDEKNEYKYSSVTLGNYGILKEQVRIFPNPANSTLFVQATTGVELSNVTISDLTGKVLLKTEVRSDDPINIEALEQGIYIISISDNRGYLSSARFVKAY